MDTFTVRLEESQELLEKVEALEEVYESTDKSYFIDELGIRSVKSFSRRFKNKHFFKVKGKDFCILRGNKDRFYNTILFSAHFSQYSSFNHFQSFSKECFGEDLTDKIINAQLSRLDLKVDLPISMKTVNHSAYVSRVRVTRTLKSSTESLYFGKNRKYICVYEKFGGVRIEARLFGRKNVPVFTLNDLEYDIGRLQPFKDFHFLGGLLGEPKEGLTINQLNRAEAFLYNVSKYGLNEAKKRADRSGNFLRSILPLFNENQDLNELLINKWAHEVSTFFGGKYE